MTGNRYIKLALGTLLSSSTIASFAGNLAAERNVIPCPTPRFELSASLLYLRPGADNLGWGVVTNFLPVTTPTWEVQTIKPNYQAGFNLGGRYIFPVEAMDVQLNWSHLRTRDSDFVAVNPSTTPTVQWISPFSQTGTPPEGGEVTGIASLKVGSARVNFQYDVVNLEVGKIIDFGFNMQTRFFSGLSGVRIREELLSTFHGLPEPVLSLNNTTSFTGIGPRLGVANAYSVCSNLQIILEFAGSLLFGNMEPAQYKFTGSSVPLALVGISLNKEFVASSSVRHVVPAVDTKIGLKYIYSMPRGSNLIFEFGYMGALYANALSSYETNTNVLALDTGSLSTSSAKHTQSNFTVDGFFLTGSWAV